MTVRVRGSVVMRSAGLTSELSVFTSAPIAGDWGQALGLPILSVVGADPDGGDGIYNEGDTITITFGNLTSTPFAGNKAAIDALFKFSDSLGADYRHVYSACKWQEFTAFQARITPADYELYMRAL